jgi:hypothetical protein
MPASRTFARLATLVALVVTPFGLSAQGRNLAGTYNTTVNSPQGALKAVITITGTKGSYGGTLAAEGFPAMPVTKVTPSDTSVLLDVDTPDGGVQVSMKFLDATKVQGTLIYQGMQMGLDGTYSAGGAAAAGGMKPTGVYTLVTTQPLMGSPAFDVLCTVQAMPNGSYGGTCGNPEAGEVPISTVTVEGNVVTISGDTPAGPFKGVVTITGTTAEGTITVGNETAKMKGTFAPK